MKIFKLIIFLIFLTFISKSTMSKSLKINGLSQLSNNDIQAISNYDIYSDDYDEIKVNSFVKNLYSSDLIDEVSFKEIDNLFIITVVEGKLIHEIKINGNIRINDEIIKSVIASKQNFFLAQKKILREAGCEDYKESIKVLFSKAYNVPLDQSYKYQNHEDLGETATLFSNMVNRRATGEPISHIVRSRIFWKNEFYIEKTVLDPRPESELIIEITKSQLFDNMKVLDLGCGSGCIGLSLYHENPNISLFLSDFSDKALMVAKKNASELKAECEMIHSNLFSNINEKFDLIVANLPYIEKESFLDLQREIILYEPHEALYGGIYGLDIIKILLSDVGRHLNRNGTFVIEFGKGQDTLLTKELLRLEFSNFTFYRDLNRITRLLCVKKDT